MHCLQITCVLLANVYVLFTNYICIVYKCLHIVYKIVYVLFTNCLCIAYKLYMYCLQIVYVLSTNYIGIVCQLSGRKQESFGEQQPRMQSKIASNPNRLQLYFIRTLIPSCKSTKLMYMFESFGINLEEHRYALLKCTLAYKTTYT